jgi:uncharacterized MAPEG superfamily protein
MTTDLWMLVWSAVLGLLFFNTYATALFAIPGGMGWGFGNRDQPLELPPWAARARRAHANLVENLAPFAVLVLVAHVTGKANATTALGAQIFFWGRVAHAVLYITGVPYARTAAFAVALVGEILILFQLF